MDGSYKYRFIDDTNIGIVKRIPMEPILLDVKNCLKSEGVDFSDGYSIVKCLDVFLRIVGISRTDENSTEIPPINGFIGIGTKFNDTTVLKMDSKTEAIYSNLFDAINDCVDEEHKFPPSDLQQIKDNIGIIFKELASYLNDVIHFMLTEFNNATVSSVTMSAGLSNDANKVTGVFSMQMYYDYKFQIAGINIISTALTGGNIDEAPLDIIYWTFAGAQKERLDKIMKNTKEFKEEIGTNADQTT